MGSSQAGHRGVIGSWERLKQPTVSTALRDQPHRAKEFHPALGKLAVRVGLLFELGPDLRICLLDR
jgi:hypothetical protein